ncbi:MAG: signal peptidase I [Acidobacteria bacterium]|nr:signal peptidase I [Acidobacteriota bacterium]
MKESDRLTGELTGELSLPEQASPSHWNLFPNWRSWIRDLVTSLGIAGVVIVFLYQPVKVEGTSMMPRLSDQERIFINKFVYRFEPIHRGDVIVFHYPLDPAKSYIKRVIGLPGETVRMVDGEVFVNGRKLTEPYVLSIYRDHQSHGPIVVPYGEFYVLGDHRNSSNDSRLWGTVARKYIYGKAVFVYWPMERFGFVE